MLDPEEIKKKEAAEALQREAELKARLEEEEK